MTGRVAVLEGPLSGVRVGTVMSGETVQLYNFTHYGFELFLTETGK